jgi:hypothetical protein
LDLDHPRPSVTYVGYHWISLVTATVALYEIYTLLEPTPNRYSQVPRWLPKKLENAGARAFARYSFRERINIVSDADYLVAVETCLLLRSDVHKTIPRPLVFRLAS